MKEEKVLEVISKVAAGNENLRIVMRAISLCGKDIINTWPEENTGILIRRTLQATSMLIHERIRLGEILLQKDEYWMTNNGKKVDAALIKFVETRKKTQS